MSNQFISSPPTIKIRKYDTNPFQVIPCSITGFSLIQWVDEKTGNTRSLQVETHIAKLWASSQDLANALKATTKRMEDPHPVLWTISTYYKNAIYILKSLGMWEN